MALKPWERYGGAPAGDPIIAPADPYKQANEVRSNEDQELQRAANRRAEEQLAISQSNAARAAENDQRAQQQAQMGSESERTAGFLSGRIVDAVGRMSTAVRQDSNAARPTIGVETVRGVLGDTAANYMTDSERQQVRAAQVDILDAALTLGTGAAYTKEQLEGYQQAYFPKLGDSDDTIKAKRDALRSLLNNAATKAGRAAPDIQKALAALDGLDNPATEPAAVEPSAKPEYGYDEQAGGLFGVTSDDSPAPPTAPPTPGAGNSYVNEIGKGIGSIVEGAAALPGMVINPIGQMMYDALGYDQQYNTGDIVRGGLGLPDNSGAGDTIIQGAAGAMTGGLAARAASSIAAPGAIRNALELVGRTPIRDTAAGAAAGGGSVVGERVGGPVGGALGAVAGGVSGYGAANALNGLAAPRTMSALGQAAQRQSVDLLPADAGGAAVRGVTGAARQSPLSAGPVARAGEAQQGQMRAATRRVAEGEGNIADTQLAGEGVRAAATRYTRETSARGSRLYDRANEQARGVRIKPNGTMAKLDQYIRRIEQDPAAPESAVSELTRFRDNIANGVTVSGLRDARTRLSQGVYDGQLRSGQETAMWRDVLSDLSTDIDAGLRQAGRTQAASSFRRADAFWKGRVEHIDEVLQPILGKDRSGEEIVATVERMTRGQGGGNARLSRLLGEMTPEEAGNTRAVVIDRLGRANPGAQNAEGSAYSAATFLTNWNKMTPQAKASLFESPALRRDLNDIAQIAEGTKVGQSAANHSNTAGAIYGNIGAGAAIAYANPAAALIAAGGQYLTGRLMASPAFARLLARTAKMPDRQAQRTFAENVGIIAGREPIIANDLRSVQQYLAQAAQQSPGRLAAQDENDRRPEPPQ